MHDDDKPGTNGGRPHGMHTRPTHLQAVEETVDLVAVQADDELINALAAGMSVSAPGLGGYDADDHVAAILAAWREEIDAEPIPELVDIDTAIATISRARPRSRARHLAPIAAAAAFVVLAAGGVTVGSSDARPGDALWGVSKVLYSQRAGSIEAAARAESRIDNAKKALTEGHSALAAQELQQAQVELAAVRPEEGAAQLAEVSDFLTAKIDETPPGTPTDPGKPLEKDRKRRVPAGAAVGTSPATKPAEPDPVTDPPTSPEGVDGTEGSNPGRDPRTLGGPGSPAATTAPVAPSAAPTGAPSSSTAPPATPEGAPASPTTPPPGQSMGTPPDGTTTSAIRTS